MRSPPDSPSLEQAVYWVADCLEDAGVFFGHGTADAIDEAAALAWHVLGLAPDDDGGNLPDPLPPEILARIAALTAARIETRKPLPYLTHEAWFAGLSFYVDERVLVPRSPIAELIETRFAPWLDSVQVKSVLDIGTGSGCIAIACALALPAARVLATDISPDALAVARGNIERYGLQGRVRLQQADLLNGLTGRFDLIVSNPPYVPDDEQQDIPDEYRHEPASGLYSGTDGLDSARRILQDAPHYLQSDGLLVLEVGAQWQALEAAFPRLPFTWIEMERGGVGVGVLTAQDLQRNL